MASSKQFSWNDISINILGKTLIGIQEIEYEVKQEKEPVYGRGSNPMSLQSGNKSYKGKLVLLQSEVDEMEAVVRAVDPTLDVTDITVEIIWTFEKGGVAITEIIQGVEFESIKKAMKQGDKFMPVDLPFMALNVIPG